MGRIVFYWNEYFFVGHLLSKISLYTSVFSNNSVRKGHILSRELCANFVS